MAQDLTTSTYRRLWLVSMLQRCARCKGMILCGYNYFRVLHRCFPPSNTNSLQDALSLGIRYACNHVIE